MMNYQIWMVTIHLERGKKKRIDIYRIDTSIASEDEEEQDYLRNIQERTTVMNRRPASVASTQTMVTAPATPRQVPTTLRPPSSMSMTRRGLQINRDLLPNSFNEHEENQLIDGNPWAQHPAIKERNLRTPTSASSLRLPSPSARPSFVASSNSSSVTATPQNHRLVYTPTSSHHESFHALGPATKRALESLQNEIVALNERIDDIRRELVERDKQRTLQYRKTNSSSNDIDTNNNSNRNTFNNNNNNNNNNNSEDDGWKWVIKVLSISIDYTSVYNFFFLLGCFETCRSESVDSIDIVFNLV